MKTTPINIPLLILSIFIIAALFCASLFLIEIDTDITGYLPQNDPVISDAGYIFENHPIHDQLVIDIGLERDDPDALVEYGELVEQRLRESGLFKQVGTRDIQDLIPDLMSHILNNLPVMLTAKDLNDKVKPLLDDDNTYKKLKDLRSKLVSLEGIGQSEFIARDPFGLKDMVLAKLSHLAPLEDLEIYKGKLISPDRKHLLLIANPISSGTDTAFARKITELLSAMSDELHGKFPENGPGITLTPVGAYRAALDNELIAKQDVEKAILLATAGIALLLIFAFPRPLLGLFAFLPALAGTVAAFFVFSLLHRSISIMTLGFGGAVISITVDHAIAYLLFLDRPHKTFGKEASREIWAVGLLAAMTTIGAFGSLCFCDFPVFEQIGLFTALGILFSFIFVHTVFPMIFPYMPPAGTRALPLRNVVSRFSSLGKKGAYALLLFALGMLFFAKPEFDVKLSSMNTVSEETVRAEELLADVWGDAIFLKTYLMTEGRDVRELQSQGDRLLEMIDQDLASGVLSSGFVPAMVFPGKERENRNIEAWREFWHDRRIAELKDTLGKASYDMGFAKEAFEPFFNTISAAPARPNIAEIPPEFIELLGISEKKDRSGWVQFFALTPGKSYNPETFYERYKSSGKTFDPSFFSLRMGKLLFSTFVKILLIVGLSVIILLFLFFLDLKLTVIALLPVLFALVSTLGTLKLLNHPIDIPGLMLSIVVIGMGIDYSIFLVRSYQRYGDDSHPSFGLIRMAVFMASASTIIGFGALCFAEHSLLRSAGLTSLLGISYALIGAFLILPPLLKYLFQDSENDISPPAKERDRVLSRYRKMEPYPRLFARFKLMIDPMFSELPGLLESSARIETIIDVGTGYGIPACWFLERFPDAEVYGIEPNHERVRVASMALQKRGVIKCGRAPDMPTLPKLADAAFMLDMTHFLTNEELGLTLKRLYSALSHGGILIIRAIIPPDKHPSLLWRFQMVNLKITGTSCNYRSVDAIKGMIIEAGFKMELSEFSGSNQESAWFVAKVIPEHD